MARLPSAPPFPDRPGAWLANFRYRARGEDGHRLSPEILGYQLGVSGATVRRWEAGSSDPSEDDLRRLAEVCNLDSLQREFLLRAYGRLHARPEGPPDNFPARASSLLSIPRPAFITDEFHYIRAWNSYVTAMRGESPVCFRQGMHVMELALLPKQDFDPAKDIERARGFVRLFWLWTAELCSLPTYAVMLRKLSANRVFRDCWLSIPECRAQNDAAPVSALFDEACICGRRYRIYAAETFLPQSYRLFVYEPADDAASELISALEKIEPPKISFAACSHWSEELSLR
jgi:transcriptional regulator with XRE-family HTH domain